MREGSVASSRAAPTVHRSDYRPPGWLVPEVALEFDLDPQRTRVRARMEFRRNGDHREPLRLNGEGLKLLSLTVDGKTASYKLDRSGLTIRVAAERAIVETQVELVPSQSEQKGLFVLGDALCTQCEAENFRRITFFPDRPDVLARFDVTLRADELRFPVLLANGNPAESGTLGDGRHWARWHDPHPKPCYLFALVAGDLQARRDQFVTASSREVALAVWIARGGNLATTAHAMASLKAAMRWDEQAFGREYDLSTYNLVALPGFAFGAMENKGLPIYDASQVLVDPAMATDAELDSAEAIVAHEYLHNWSGNRVTIRDWFEMPLKEGLTVFRDQQFSAALGSPAVKRIEDARAVRLAQFAEDEGPGARAPRPDSYAEPAELYTPTVYLKGAETVRMLHTVIGGEAFRAGADLFFARHDGQAVTCDALLAAMSVASGAELADFALWYGRAGTPLVHATLRHEDERAVLALTPLPPGDRPLPIPVRLALFGAVSGAKLAERLVILRGAEEFILEGIRERPLLSLNRRFSAPVLVETERSLADLMALARHDDDPFARHEAMQLLMGESIREAADPTLAVAAVGEVLAEATLEPGLVAELVSLPREAEIADKRTGIDPAQLHDGWLGLRAGLGRAHEAQWRRLQALTADPADRSAHAKGTRRLRSIALDYLLAGGARGAGALGLAQFESAPTMTERQGALRALADSGAPERATALAAFYGRYREDPHPLDAWFSIQASSARADTIETAPRLLAHPDFTLAHPTRLGAIVGAFAGNFHAFHDASGRGYRFLADVALVLDRMNPAGAARLVRAMGSWRQLEPARRGLLLAQLERIASAGASANLTAAVGALLR